MQLFPLLIWNVTFIPIQKSCIYLALFQDCILFRCYVCLCLYVSNCFKYHNVKQVFIYAYFIKSILNQQWMLNFVKYLFSICENHIILLPWSVNIVNYFNGFRMLKNFLPEINLFGHWCVILSTGCPVLFVYILCRIFALIFISEFELQLCLKFEEDNLNFSLLWNRWNTLELLSTLRFGRNYLKFLGLIHCGGVLFDNIFNFYHSELVVLFSSSWVNFGDLHFPRK